MKTNKGFIILSGLMGLDVVSTLVGLRHGLSEGNPLIQGLLVDYPAWLVLVVGKVGGLALIYALLKPLSGRMERVSLGLCNVVMFVVVSWNVSLVML